MPVVESLLLGMVKGIYTVGAATVSYSTYQFYDMYIRDHDKPVKKKLKKAIERSGLAIVDKRKKPYKIERPVMQYFKRTDFGYEVCYKLPVGITKYDCLNQLDVIESAMDAEINTWTEGQRWYMQLYTHPIPQSLSYEEAVKNRKKDTIVLGQSRKGLEILDFKESPNPHILIGGMAGMGKSNMMNVILTQLLDMNVELYLIDPKRVEFNVYKDQPKVKMLGKDVTQGREVAEAVVEIMRAREEAFDKAGFQNIHIINSKIANPLPYVFLVIDEFSDFEGDKYFWQLVSAIARKGRALGVYLIMATQRPSAEVLSQQVKANMGTKIAFKVTTIGNSKILCENAKAFLLPNRPGRAILDVGEQREMQVPYLSREVHMEILKKHKGDVEYGVINWDAFNVDSVRRGNSNKATGKRAGTYGLS